MQRSLAIICVCVCAVHAGAFSNAIHLCCHNIIIIIITYKMVNNIQATAHIVPQQPHITYYIRFCGILSYIMHLYIYIKCSSCLAPMGWHSVFFYALRDCVVVWCKVTCKMGVTLIITVQLQKFSRNKLISYQNQYLEAVHRHNELNK